MHRVTDRLAAIAPPLVIALALIGGCGPEKADETDVSGAGGTAGAVSAGGTGGAVSAGGTGGTRDGAAAAPARSNAGLPCDVAALFETRCQSCHAEPPLYGAPMALTRFEDTQGSSADGTRKTWEAMIARVEDGTMPPRSAGALTATEKATLLAWLRGGPKRAGETKCAAKPVGTPDGGAAPAPAADLGCKPAHTITAGVANEGFDVPPASDNLYKCFNIPSPFAKDEQAVEWKALIGDSRVVHHWILYKLNDPSSTSASCSQSKTFIMGWAPGQNLYKMPPGVGYQLPDPGERMILEIHYNNPTRIPGIKDRTGVAICTSKTPLPNEAGTLTLGSAAILLWPRSKDVAVKSTCTAKGSEPFHVISTSAHMHKLGTRFTTTLESGGKTTSILDIPKWDFNDQQVYPKDPMTTIVRPGDKLTTTCFYSNPTDKLVTFGEKTEDEMCLNFVSVYPVKALAYLKGEWCSN